MQHQPSNPTFEVKRGDAGGTYSSLVMFARSFKSAPAQNAASALLAMTSALVGPVPPSAAIELTCLDRSSTIARDSAFRACGRFSSSTRTFPEPGAGTCWVLITASSALVLYRDTLMRIDDVGSRANADESRTSRGDIVLCMTDW